MFSEGGDEGTGGRGDGVTSKFCASPDSESDASLRTQPPTAERLSAMLAQGTGRLTLPRQTALGVLQRLAASSKAHQRTQCMQISRACAYTWVEFTHAQRTQHLPARPCQNRAPVKGKDQCGALGKRLTQPISRQTTEQPPLGTRSFHLQATASCWKSLPMPAGSGVSLPLRSTEFKSPTNSKFLYNRFWDTGAR